MNILARIRQKLSPGNVVDNRWSLTIVIGLLFFLTHVGCKKSGSAKSRSAESGDQAVDTKWQVETTLDAAAILGRVQKKYREAKAYTDQGTLHLSYRLQGNYLAEPHQWKVSFLREKGLNVDLYDARIRCDDSQLACFIYDFSSGNLDNQWQVHKVIGKRPPINKLFQDGICRHYITGQSELPINPQRSDIAELLFPPTVGLLTGQTESWLTKGDSTRLADEIINGRTFFSLKIKRSDLTWFVLVDSDTYLISSIKYPTQVLDERLQNNPNVENLEIVARFNGATLTPEFETDTFQVSIPGNAKRVRNFVAVPEPFPSPKVGKPIGQLGLRDVNTQPISQASWNGKVTLLCWTNPAIVDDELNASLQKVANTMDVKQYNVARIEVVENSQPGNPEVVQQLKSLALQSSIPLLADFGFESGRSIGLDHYPIIAVLDRQNVLQFVRSLHDQSLDAEEMSNVMLRVRSGDDVAGEMRAEYESFLDLYQSRLATAMISNEAGKDDGTIAAASAPRFATIRHRWKNDTVAQPGNIAMSDNAGRQTITLLDGWRTVLQLDMEGREQQRQEIDLQNRESINVVRNGQANSDHRIVFSAMGKTVRVLNQKLASTKTISAKGDRERIRDANLLDVDGDGVDELLIAFTSERGSELVSIGGSGEQTDRSRPFSKNSFRSATVVKKRNGSRVLLACDQKGRLQETGANGKQTQFIDCDLIVTTKVFAPGEAASQTTVACAVGTNRQGQWTAIGLSNDLKQIWSIPIGSQRFDTQVESVSFATSPGSRSGVWAIAALDGSVKLVMEDGKQVDNWCIGSAIRGIQIAAIDSQYRVIISTDATVEAWDLVPTGTAASVDRNSLPR